MQPRFSYAKLSPGAYQAMIALEKYLAQSSVEENLLHLVKFRVSQINGCAYCLDMHSKDLRALGETEQRLYSLDAWRECPTTPNANEPHSPGPRPLPSSPRATPLTRCTPRPAPTSPNRRSPT